MRTSSSSWRGTDACVPSCLRGWEVLLYCWCNVPLFCNEWGRLRCMLRSLLATVDCRWFVSVVFAADGLVHSAVALPHTHARPCPRFRGASSPALVAVICCVCSVWRIACTVCGRRCVPPMDTEEVVVVAKAPCPEQPLLLLWDHVSPPPLIVRYCAPNAVLCLSYAHVPMLPLARVAMPP